MSTRFKTFIVLIISILGVAYAWGADYIVKPGETLSTIAHQFISGRVYGTHGSLNQVLALNPKLGSNPNLIFAGQKILVPTTQTLTEVPDALIRNPASENVPNQNLNSQTQACSESAPTAPKANPVADEKPRAPASDSSDEDLDHHLEAGLGYHFKTFTAQDSVNSSSAKLFTSSDLEFDAAWSQDWNKSVSTFFEFGFEKLNFEPSNNPNKSLNNTEQSPAHFSLGADIHATSNFVLRTTATYGQELFTGSQSGNISIDSVFIPKVSEELIFTALTRGRTSVGIEGGGSYLMSSSAGSYEVHSGYAVNGAVFLNQHFGRKNNDTLILSVGYENTQQNTSIVNQTVGDGFAKIMFSMPIFGGDEK